MARIPADSWKPMRSLPSGVHRQATEVEIVYEGEPLRAVQGESLAAALVAAGRLDQRGGRSGAAHGHFCGMGACFECLVHIDGVPGQRACMVPVRNGMVVGRQAYLSTPHADGTWAALAEPPAAGLGIVGVDVLVVGAGPAGLEAALAARRAGAGVTIVDERAAPGGQYYKQLAAAYHTASGKAPDRQMESGRTLIAAAQAEGIALRTETTVWGAFREAENELLIGIERRGEASLMRPRSLIIATGATEAPYPVPGWTLPGVMTTGGLQTLLRSYRTAPPGPIVVAGNGPLNLQVAAELVKAGAQVAAVVESGRPFAPRRLPAGAAAFLTMPSLMLQGLGYLATLRRAGVPILYNHAVAGIEGETAVRGVRVAAVGADGRLAATSRLIAAVSVGLGYGFLPQAEISRQLGIEHDWDAAGLGYVRARRDADGRTSLPGVFVAGEAGGIGGAQIAMAQGALAGMAAARHCGYLTNAPAAGPWHRQLSRHRSFQRRLWAAFSSPLVPLAGVTPDTVLCRCEDVTVGEVTACLSQTGADLGAVKRQTRAGMGRCQGRYCAASLRHLLAGSAAGSPLDLPAPQLPIKPVPLAAIAVEKPEWGGHRQAPSFPVPERHGTARGPLASQVTIIGAGIAGVSTALFLARNGMDVTVLDAGTPNGQASGGNAGSIHVQLASFDFGRKAQAGGGPAAHALPLQLAATRMWEALAAELATEMEFVLTGGLMVAETQEQLRFLERKTQLERAYGIEVHVVGQAEARRLVPGISADVLGGAWCPDEGKINPMLATPALIAAAQRAGARFLAGEAVRAIERSGGDWLVTTARGTIRAPYVVNAAGPWARSVGRLVGLELPVEGVPFQMIATEPAAAMVDVLLSHADRHLTLKQVANGNIVIGGGWPAGQSRPYRHPRALRDSREGNLWVAQKVLPALRGLRMLRSWGAMNVNIDGAPILGEAPGLPGFFNAVAATGYTMGPRIGQITADLICKGSADIDLQPFSVQRFRDEA
jgi:glycine/D-amino acid oxidase-like deaminating enzyme